MSGASFLSLAYTSPGFWAWSMMTWPSTILPTSSLTLISGHGRIYITSAVASGQYDIFLHLIILTLSLRSLLVSWPSPNPSFWIMLCHDFLLHHLLLDYTSPQHLYDSNCSSFCFCIYHYFLFICCCFSLRQGFSV